jgi:AcrR family transcriptional regulator
MSGSPRPDRPDRPDAPTAADPSEAEPRVPVWARSREPRRRPALTPEAVVAAAIALADAQGLAAVSIRRVAAELGARAMSLYSHIESKDDLLDLMYDEVNGEILIEGELPGDWRAAIALIAGRTRAVLLRHPWMVQLAGRRPRVGPNGLRHGEQSLVALAPLGLDLRSAMRISSAVDDYMLGHVIREIMAGETPPDEGASADRDGHATMEPYFRRMLDSGEFPNLAPLLAEGLPPIEETFEQGLGWLLDGIARAHGIPDAGD